MHPERYGGIIISFILGFLIAGGIFFLPQYINKIPSSPVPQVLHQGQTEPSPKEQVLSIIVPDDYQRVSNTKTTIRGKTKPQSTIVISTPIDDYVTETDPTGNFEQEAKLADGAQEVMITTFLPDGGRDTIKRTLFVTPSKEEQ